MNTAQKIIISVPPVLRQLSSRGRLSADCQELAAVLSPNNAENFDNNGCVLIVEQSEYDEQNKYEPVRTEYDEDNEGEEPVEDKKSNKMGSTRSDCFGRIEGEEPIKDKKQSIFNKCFGANSSMGAIFNLIVAIIGAGILSFPFAMKAAGLLWGLLLLLICTFFSYISLNLLTIASTYLHSIHIRQTTSSIRDPSYLTLSHECGGSKLVIFTQINVILSLLGSAISRIIAAGGIIGILYEEYFKNGDRSNEKEIDQYFIVAIGLLIIFPLSLMRNMSSLRFTSLLSVSCSIFLTICLFIQYFVLCDEYNSCIWKQSVINNNHLASFTWNGILTAVPLFIFGFNCQPNVFPIYMELEATNTSSKMKKMNSVFKYALSISVTLYIVAGSSAFLIFLEETDGNILLNDFDKSPDILIASIMFTVAMVLAAPVFVNSIREKINDMIWGKKQINTVPHILVTFGIVIVCLSVSVSVKDISKIMGFIGSTTNPITGYVLPTYFVWKLIPKRDNKYKIIKMISIIMVIIVISVSLGSLYMKICDAFI